MSQKNLSKQQQQALKQAGIDWESIKALGYDLLKDLVLALLSRLGSVAAGGGVSPSAGQKSEAAEQGAEDPQAGLRREMRQLVQGVLNKATETVYEAVQVMDELNA